MDKKVISINKLRNSNSKDTADDLNDKAGYKSLVSKYFSKKNIKIIILLLIGLFTLFLFMGMDKKDDNLVNTSSAVNRTYTTTLEYCAELENKLERVLSGVSGAGNVSVMVSVSGSPEIVYATSDDNKTSSTSNGSTVTSSSNPIIIESNGSANPLILTENLPEVKGVIVVSSGADNVAIKLDILTAVSTLLNISTDKISVLKGI